MRRHSLIVAIALAATLAPVAHASTPTGRLLVLTDGAAATDDPVATTPQAVAARTGGRLAGHQIPQIGLVTLRPGRGQSTHELVDKLRADPAVASVTAEHRATKRLAPTDPAFVEPIPGSPPGTTYEWWANKENFPAAWDVTQGRNALVGVIDTGVDVTHPDLAGRIAFDIDQDPRPEDGSVGTDPAGHGTHVASLACAADSNGIGLVGAGLGCRLIVEKTDLSDSSVAASIIDATNKGAQAINMSFGTNGEAPAPKAIVDAINYAYAHNVVLVAAANDVPVTEQGDPSNVLQPSNTGPNITQGIGLDVTAADFAGHRASFAGHGTQISIAAYGAYGAQNGGPAGLLGAFPAQTTLLDTGSAGPPAQPACNCRTSFDGDQRYAFLQGTSMAAPQVAAAAALVRSFNPGMGAADTINLLKQTATRPAGVGWTDDLGWGILNAGAALEQAKSIDRTPPVSKLTVAKPTSTKVTLRWAGSDVPPPGVVSTGVAKYEVYHSINGAPARRFLTTTQRSTKVTLQRGKKYTFYTLAIDNAGNRELAPKRPDATLRLRVLHTSRSKSRHTRR